MNQIKAFLIDESGPTAVEYAVMLGLIIALCIVTIGNVGTEAAGLFEDSDNKMQTAFGN